MDAMILAAGQGTRLRPLTDQTPKALIEVGGIPMIERITRRLVGVGADRLIVNVHHHADMVARFLAPLSSALDVDIYVSREVEHPLETGGGLLHAAPFFRRDAPFLLHNVDVITGVDLRAFYDAHERGALATLAVHERETARFLLFDDKGLFGWQNVAKGMSRSTRDTDGRVQRVAFAGIHVVSPEIFGLFTEDGVFSILDVYLRLAAEGWRIAQYDMTGAFWVEVGTPERLARAEELVAKHRVE